MDQLLDQAQTAFDAAEAFAIDSAADTVGFANGGIHNISTELVSGLAVRVFREGRVGMAYTRDAERVEELLANAALSLGWGAEADYQLPVTRELAHLDSFDAAIEEASTELMADELERICGELSSRTDGEARFRARTSVTTVRVANTAGVRLSARSSVFSLSGGLSLPGSAEAVVREHQARRHQPLPDQTLQEIVSLYAAHHRDAKPTGGRMKVLFMPNSMVTLLWRLASGTSGRSVFEGTSPIADKVGERVLSEQISFVDDPRSEHRALPRPFDDEGVECDRLPLIEGGVLRGFFADLEHAGRLGVKPTGSGYRTALWGGDPITLQPTSALGLPTIEAGAHSFAELVSQMDRGIIVEGVLGPHSGNIPNGDYSIGVCPALYVEGGEIVGRVRDAMVAGNVWETLRDVVGVGKDAQRCLGGRAPAVLCDGVSVAIR